MLLSPKQKFKRFIENFDGVIYDHDIPILASEYRLSPGTIKYHMAEAGFWVVFYRDEICTFVYYINDDKNHIESVLFEEPEGHIIISGNIFVNASSYGIQISGNDNITNSGNVFTPEETPP